MTVPELPQPNTRLDGEVIYPPTTGFDPGGGVSVKDLLSGDGPYEGETRFAGRRAVLLNGRRRIPRHEEEADRHQRGDGSGPGGGEGRA